MFRRLPDPQGATTPECSFEFDGQHHVGYIAESVAAVLLRANVPAFRLHPLDGSPRLPYCMMGVCQECLVRAQDGTTRRACLLPVAEGLRLSSASASEGSE